MSERGNLFLRFLDFWAGIPLVLLTVPLRKLVRRQIPQNPTRICILCQAAIGDLLLLSGLLHSLQNKFPAAKLDLILSPANADAASLLEPWHQVHVFSIKRPDKIISMLRKQKYDLLIDSSQWARLGAIISNCSGASCTVGFESPGQYRHYGFDLPVRHQNMIHEKDNFIALGKVLWPDLQGDCALRLKKMESGFGSMVSNPLICFHMWPSGIKRHLKEWPEASWKELANKFLDAGYTILLTGGAADKFRTEKFISLNFSAEERIKSIAGITTLEETASLIKRSEALISVNTGIMHLGALLGVPTVGLHGPTNPVRWGPIGKKCKALLPQKGINAYLDLGFEYPAKATNNLRYLPITLVLDALEELGIKLKL